MKGKKEAVPQSTESSSLSNYELAKFILKLIRNNPRKVLAMGRIRASGSQELVAYLGKEVVEVLGHLKPDLYAAVDVLLSSHHGTNPDDLYEAIQPILDKLLSQNIGDYGVSLKDLGVHRLLTESYIKSDLLPIFSIVRDIPKFCKSIKEKDFLKTIKEIRTQLLTHLETDLHSEIRKYLVVGTDGLYDIKPQDPALVSQIKKILNALSYAEKVLTFINSMDLNPDTGFKLEQILAKKGDKQIEFMTKITWYLAMKDSVVGNWLSFNLDVEPEELKFIHEIEQAIKYAREAQSSLLEIDIPTYKIFGEELRMLAGVIESLQSFTTDETRTLLENRLSSTDKIAETVGDYVGKPLGIFIDQLKPHDGKTDYSFLTRHLGLLPGHLDQLTQVIYAYGGQPGTKPALTDADTDVFKDSAIRLFFELSNYDNLMFWQKGFAVLFPIRKDAVTLSQGAYQQVMRVNEATGEMVAYQLSRVKNELFTKIICESDKVELYLGYAPGVLTKPLMLKLNDLYQTLVLYANSVIDLKEKYPDLLQLDNTSFLTKRLQNALQQKNECQLKVDTALKAKQDLETFISNFYTSKTEEERDALKKLYQSIEPYVIEYNPRLSVLIHDFFSKKIAHDKLSFSKDDLQLMNQAVKKLCNKEAATFSSYLKLADSRLSDIPRQIKGKLYPLDPQKPHAFLIINELGWLVENKKLVQDKNAPVSTNHQFIDDLTSLTPENRAELYNYHSIRVLSLKHVQQELDIFLQQLSQSDGFSNQKKINSIIKRYRVLQPYLVDSISASAHDETDKLFVDLMNGLANNSAKPKQFVVILDAMKAGVNKLKNPIGAEIRSSESRQVLFEYAHRQVREEQTVLFNKASLTLESELVQRQDKWIRHQRLSRASENMKDVLLNMLTQFDPSLKLSAKSSSDNVVPFPEMENDLEALAVPRQVSWAKRMLNLVHYINSNFKYLESLDKDIHKKDVSHYFLKGPLVEGIYQIKPFLELTKAYQTLTELMEEPTGQLLVDTLKGGYSELMGAWETLKPLYFISSDEVHLENPDSVKSSGLWYPLLSLMVLPEHLTKISSGKPYTPLEAEQAQKKAKDVSQFIEEITEQFQTSQYFSLLMKSPYILFKFLPELKDKLDKLRDVTHGVTIQHLQEIQAILQNILKETDNLELKFGLRAGLVSNPTRLIIDKLFNSFIEPLGISLQESSQLVLNTTIFKQRLDINHQKQAETTDMLKSEKQLLVSLDHFLKILVGLKTKIDAKQAISPTEKEQFKSQYWEIYPLLQSQRGHYSLSLDQRDKSIELDKFCDECFKEKLGSVAADGQIYHYSSLNDVMYLVKHVHAAKKGNINTLEMRAGYLSAQSRSISSAKQEFVNKEGKEALEACINRAIDVNIQLICKKTSQSVYLASEFKSRLLTLLLSKKEEILQKASSIPVSELEKTISLELQKQFQLFTKTEYIQLSHLDRILTEIEHFQAYCQKEKLNPIYESTDPATDTLMPKIELLNRLKAIAENKHDSLDNRIAKITEEAKKDTFYTILMSHDNHFKFNLKSIKRVFLNLFHSIFNFFGVAYHPADIYTSLNKVIKDENPSLDKSLLIKTGFFSEDGQEKLASKSKDTAEHLSDQFKKPSLS